MTRPQIGSTAGQYRNLCKLPDDGSWTVWPKGQGTRPFIKSLAYRWVEEDWRSEHGRVVSIYRITEGGRWAKRTYESQTLA